MTGCSHFDVKNRYKMYLGSAKEFISAPAALISILAVDIRDTVLDFVFV